MIPKECKRLAEVDFPIATVSRHSAREKSIRHGHPSTLHLWWARRPLGACRSMLLGLLLPDPCDDHCPGDFRAKARKLLEKTKPVDKGDPGLREALLRFIGDFANWDLSSNATYLEVARGLVKAAHGEEPPLVVDPFAGGGSIPLEALRLGCDAFASDLNPVACLILKTMLEDIPRHGPKLAEELRRVGAEIKAAAEKELAEFYPPDPDGARPIAYLWARTVRCEAPDCGAEIPLARSFWLCKKAERRRALRPKVVAGKPPRVEFEIFTPKNDRDVPPGTVTRAKASCVACGRVLSPDRVRAQLRERHGGADDARLLAVVTLQPGMSGRQYRSPVERDFNAVRKARKALEKLASQPLENGLSPVPDEPLPPQGTLGFRVQLYGMTRWGDLFSARQKLTLTTLARLVERESETLGRLLALTIGKLVDLANAICRWEPVAECPRNVFGSGRVKPSWDFAEGVPLSDSSGGLLVCLENLIAGITSLTGVEESCSPQVSPAQRSPLPDDACQVWFTDPPYYDAIPYADLSDVFYVWQKRALPGEPLLNDPFDPNNRLTPKLLEIVEDEVKRSGDGKSKDRSFFATEMESVFRQGRRILMRDAVGCVVFAHKTTEGWEALISGMINGGWTVTGSWPIATEAGHRLRARDSAALVTSVHLICRPRDAHAQVGDWAHVLRQLPVLVADWMDHLGEEGIRGADLVFACIGPALEIFSQYSKVETPEGRVVQLPEFLEKIWETVGRKALERVLGTADTRTRKAGAPSLEEDARLTALFLWTLQSTEAGVEAAEPENGEDVEEDDEEGQAASKGGYTLIYDVVRRFAQPLGIHLEDWEGRVIETEKGVVRLLGLDERAKRLFGEEGADAVADQIEEHAADLGQLMLFPEERRTTAPRVKARKKGGGARVEDKDLQARKEATTLDRVHMAMLLQRSGRSNALRNLVESEIERGPEFERLANSLSALYPKGSEEKRLLDAMLQAIRRK